jgi:hypothetical protein
MINPGGLARRPGIPPILAIFRAGFGLRLADRVDYYSSMLIAMVFNQPR